MIYVLNAGALLLTGAAVFCFFMGIYDPLWEKLKGNAEGYAEWMRTQLDSMFIDVTPLRCFYMVMGSTFGLGLIGFLLLFEKEWTWGWILVRVVVVLMLMRVGWMIPRWVVRFMWDRRVAKFDDQMLDALTLMSNALKAGLSFIQAMDTVAKEMPNPIGQEFNLVLRHQQLGGGVNESLQQLESRMGSEDVRIIVTAIMILRDTGGNLSETFDTMAFTIRERKKVKGKIAALTAQGIMQGIIIFCMPFVLGVILYVMDPILIARMWQTTVGFVFLGIMAFLQIMGGWLMRKMVTIEV